TVRARGRNGSVVLEVSDTGGGIGATDRARLFEPFFRSHEATAQAIPGTGLGLTITKAIVDAHGGTIEVESAPGAGTTFRVRLPARQRVPVQA
ncbi:MAG: sensor histidine kinase, partial [Gaiellaceae bacterium]